MYSLIVAFVVLLSSYGLTSQSGSSAEGIPTWQGQYDLGMRYLSDGNYEEAIIAFKAANKVDSKRAEAYLSLANTYEAVEDWDSARSILEDALDAVDDIYEIQSFFIYNEDKKGSVYMKKTVFTLIFLILFLASCGNGSLLSSEDKMASWQEQYDLGIRLLSEENYEEAIIAFTAAIEIDNKQATAYVGRGQAYLAYKELDDRLNLAKVDFEQALELDDSIVDAWKGLARAYLRMGEYNSAKDTLVQAIGVLGELQELSDLVDQVEESRGSTELTQTLQQGNALKYDDAPDLFSSPASSLGTYFGEGGGSPHPAFDKDNTRYNNGVGYPIQLDTYIYYGKKEPNHPPQYDVWVWTLVGSQEVYEVDANCFNQKPITGYSGWLDIQFGDTKEQVLQKLGLDASYAQFGDVRIEIYPSKEKNEAGVYDNLNKERAISWIVVDFCEEEEAEKNSIYQVQLEFNNRGSGVLDRAIYRNEKLRYAYEASIGVGG